MIVAFANSKGGVGKSTLAVHLTAWLAKRGESVTLVDADVQGSSSVWLAEACPDIPQERLQTPDALLDSLPRIRKAYKWVVVDGPAGLSEVTRAILLLADLALLPCGPSVLDLRAANDAIKVLKQAQTIRGGPPRALFVPNKLQVQYRLSQELLDTARSLEIPTTSGIRLRQAYADAVGQGSVVWEMGPRAADAAGEIEILFQEVIPYEPTTTINEPSAANS